VFKIDEGKLSGVTVPEFIFVLESMGWNCNDYIMKSDIKNYVNWNETSLRGKLIFQKQVINE
jgi:hypothetical protein